jgi:hypothetical protein
VRKFHLAADIDYFENGAGEVERDRDRRSHRIPRSSDNFALEVDRNY